MSVVRAVCGLRQEQVLYGTWGEGPFMGHRESPWVWALMERNELLSQKLINGEGGSPLPVGLPPRHRCAEPGEHRQGPRGFLEPDESCCLSHGGLLRGATAEPEDKSLIIATTVASVPFPGRSGVCSSACARSVKDDRAPALPRVFTVLHFCSAPEHRFNP